MESIQQWIPLLAPIVLVEFALKIVALVDLARRERTKGPKWVWVLVIVLINLIGPVLYFLFGRDE
jgi:hypothetical protein